MCCAVSAICALNMNLFYGMSSGIGWAVPRSLTPVDLSVLLAVANLGVFAWNVRLLHRHAGERDPGAPTPSTTTPAASFDVPALAKG